MPPTNAPPPEAVGETPTEAEFCARYREFYRTEASDRDILFCEERLLEFVRHCTVSALAGAQEENARLRDALDREQKRSISLSYIAYPARNGSGE